MIRRTFATDDGRAALVTYDPTTDTVHLAFRSAAWDQWSRPMVEILDERQDDPPAPAGGRVYGEDGRVYNLTPVDPNAGFPVPPNPGQEAGG